MKYFIIGLISVVIISCTNNEVIENRLNTENIENSERRNSEWAWNKESDKNGNWQRIIDLNLQDFTGLIVKFYDNENTFSESIYTLGREDTLKNFDTTGVLLSTTYLNNEQCTSVIHENIGDFKWYHQNLTLRKFGTIIRIKENQFGNRDFLDGKIISFYENGDTSSIENFIDSQFKNGQFKTWYPNGQLQSIENFITNMRIGLYKKYSEEGKLIEEANLGFAMGYVQAYYANGNLKSKIHYYQYVKDGSAYYFDEVGNHVSTREYSKDSLISEKLHPTNK